MRREKQLPGIQEILLLVLIFLAVFFVPRIAARRHPPRISPSLPSLARRLSGRVRLALLISFAWPLLTALFLKPWQKDLFRYVCIGIAPVTGAWGVGWVVAGFRRKGMNR